jgi:hypothetical protein
MDREQLQRYIDEICESGPKPNERQVLFLYNALQGKNIALLGPPGSGKTFVTNILHDILKLIDPTKNFVRTATTGMASTHLTSNNGVGKTFYNWLNSGSESMIGHLPEFLNKLRKHPKCKIAVTSTDVLQIDESSMLNIITYTNIDVAAREHRKCRRHFGGIQTILSGDIMQLGVIDVSQGAGHQRDLPPITIPGILDSLPDHYEVVMLTELMRTDDPLHQKILNGIVSRNVEVRKRAIDILNLCCFKEKLEIPDALDKASEEGYVIVTYTNNVVDTYNRCQQAIFKSRYPQGPTPISQAKIINTWDKLSRESKQILENEQGMRREEKEIVDRRSFEIDLRLYPEQPIMLRRNTDLYKNGEKAIFKSVESNDDNEIIAINVLRTKDKKLLRIEKMTHTSEFAQDVGYEQFAIIANAADTIHKMQGSTLDGIVFDTTNLEISGKDAARLIYTAASRTKSLKSICLTEPIKLEVIANYKVQQELDKLWDLDYMYDYPQTNLTELNTLYREYQRNNRSV